jgi:hypothetical protein
MKPSRLRRFCSVRNGVACAAACAGLLIAGCSNIFIPKHKVLVDAIAAPGVEKPSGKSYRLVAKRSVVSAIQAQVPVIKACVDAALLGQGMFEAPPNSPPDIFIEVSYGRDAAARIDPSARETFLQLSARSNPDGALDRATGSEIWDVMVAVLGVAGGVETAMPLLSAVAATHVATNTRMEMKFDIPQNSPMIEAVRTSAIKTLEAKSQPPPPVTAPMMGTPSTTAPAVGTPTASTR